MFLGSICSPYNQVKKHTENINQLKLKHNFFAEIKWSSVSNSKLPFYCDLVDYFYQTELKFRTVGVVKDKIDYQAFNKSYDEFYYTMYYYLLNNNIETENSYNVYLDIKDTLSARKVNKLKDILNIKFGVFRNLQNIRSHESLLMQLTDFLMGAISYLHNNEAKKNPAKQHIIEKLQRHSGDKLQHTNYSSKFNLFFISLR
jgi:hypothetical protein